MYAGMQVVGTKKYKYCVLRDTSSEYIRIQVSRMYAGMQERNKYVLPKQFYKKEANTIHWV